MLIDFLNLLRVSTISFELLAAAIVIALLGRLDCGILIGLKLKLLLLSSTFSILLIICMLILSLLGMELFGHKVKYDHHGTIVTDIGAHEGEVQSPRPNFDNIFMSFVTIFVVFIGEDWNSIMYDHHRAGGFLSLIFFPILFIILNLVLLNLFLAILLRNFDDVDEGGKNEEDDADASSLKKAQRKVE